MAHQALRLGLFLLLLVEVRTHVPAAGAAGAAAGAAGAAGAAAGAAGMMGTRTTRPKHMFCTRPPPPRSPKIPIFHMEVHTGFYNGYRSNQSVVVDIQAKYPETWRINQFFIHVPDKDPYVYLRGSRPRPGFVPPKEVGHWMWNLSPDRGVNASDKSVGGSQPVDCGGMTNYGPFGMLSSMGAHAAMQLAQYDTNFKGYSKVEAKWVPPTNWQNIMNRKMITIDAYVTFEKTPPGSGGYGHSHYHYGPYHRPYGTQPARWVKKSASLLNLDYIDIQNYLMRFRPYMSMMQNMMKAIKK